MMDKRFICSECGEEHPFENIELSFDRPDAIAELPADERIPERYQESNDLCALWGSAESEHRYFVRGVIPFAVREQRREYSIGAWAEVDRYSLIAYSNCGVTVRNQKSPRCLVFLQMLSHFTKVRLACWLMSSSLGLKLDQGSSCDGQRISFILSRLMAYLHIRRRNTHRLSSSGRKYCFKQWAAPVAAMRARRTGHLAISLQP